MKEGITRVINGDLEQHGLMTSFPSWPILYRRGARLEPFLLP